MAHSGTAMRDLDARRALKDDLARVHCRVHQPEDPPFFTREPRTPLETIHWKWTTLEPLLRRIGEEIELGSGGQRRTLRLTNPGVAFGTTHTFWASIQVILPGEIASAHRHTANAFRFIMQGSGATTTVDGARIAMNEGDLVYTHGGTWHDHQHHGSAPMIWLDVLDINLMNAMQATFFEPFQGEVQPVENEPKDSPLLFSRAKALAALDGAATDAANGRFLQYPDIGTLGMQLIRLPAGYEGRARRQVGSKLFYAVAGTGTLSVGDKRFDWARGDFMVVPPWAWHAHANAGKEDALLFEVDDTPAMKLLGYYREETK